MFYSMQTKASKDEYKAFLKTVGCLSNLFSDSDTPYLYYRVAEKIFCGAFDAEDLSRSDVSADAKKLKLGIGLKTFLAGNNKTYQKVAEFNRDRPLYINLPDKELIGKVSELRNTRISLTERMNNLDSSIYHCVLREAGEFKIFEEPMHYIQKDQIIKVVRNRNSITFEDGISEYSFSLSKSTLNKRFKTSTIIDTFPVEILSDPLSELQKLFQEREIFVGAGKRIIQTIFLPLYGRDKKVYERSGLNQWNANGRKRHANEAYISIPSFIHKKFNNFFPARDTPFDLKLPTGEVLQSKVCQDNGKALMSHSNKELGEWILRKVLHLPERELLTYEWLQELGIDSVRIDKINDNKFEINFSKLNSFEKFKKQVMGG